MIIVVVLSSADSSPPTPTDVLGEARDFVADADSVVYTGDFEVEATDPESEGSAFVQRGSFEESAIFPNRGRSVIDFNGVSTETLFIGDERYARDADSIAALADERFGRFDLEELDDIVVELDPDLLFDKPQALGRMFRQARGPRITRRSDDRTVLRVQLPPDLLPSLGTARSIDDVEGVLILRDEGLPERLELRAQGDGLSLRMRLEFLEWNATRLRIAEPEEADLDPTPFVDEERVAAYDDTPLYQPAAIPTDWELKLADVISAEQSGLDCAQATIVFANADPGTAGIMLLTMMPVSCSPGAPPTSDELLVGPYRGWIVGDPSTSGVGAQVDVDGTAVQVSTDLTREQVTEVLSALVPFDLANPPPATLSLAEAV